MSSLDVPRMYGQVYEHTVDIQTYKKHTAVLTDVQMLKQTDGCTDRQPDIPTCLKTFHMPTNYSKMRPNM